LPTITSANVALAVNGRVGRRVAAVLDSDGTGLEMLDLEGDEDEEADDAEDEEGAEEEEAPSE
jgi:anaphase-promoting complex subunit 4